MKFVDQFGILADTLPSTRLRDLTERYDSRWLMHVRMSSALFHKEVLIFL